MSRRIRWSVVREVAKREIVTMARTRVWRIATAFLVLLVVAGIVAAAVFDSGDDDDRRPVEIGFVGSTDELQAALGDPLRSNLDVTWIELGTDDVASALMDDEVDVVVEVVESDANLVWANQVDGEIDLVLRITLQELAIGQKAAQLGLSQDDLSELLGPADIEARFIDSEDVEGDDDGTGVGVALAVLTLLGLQTYGNLLVLGVVQEKESRVVEVLLAHVRARELLMGKIVGLGSLALAQVLALAVAALAAIVATGTNLTSGSIWWVAALGIVTFVLGFGWFATLLAAAGSLVSRQEDAQQVVAPVVLPLVAVYLFSVISVTSNADSGVSRALSYVPLSSPFAMPMRVAADSAAAWEIALAVMLLLGAVWAASAFAGRVYEFTLLRTGTRISLRDALRLSNRDS